MDYSELIKELRDSEEWATKDGGIPVGLIYRLSQAADVIEELQKALDAVNDAHNEGYDVGYWAGRRDYEPKWIPVTERLPKYGERVLVFGGFTMYVAYYDKNRYGGESWHKLNSKSHYCNPTHWMPLPEPPKEETE